MEENTTPKSATKQQMEKKYKKEKKLASHLFDFRALRESVSSREKRARDMKDPNYIKKQKAELRKKRREGRTVDQLGITFKKEGITARPLQTIGLTYLGAAAGGIIVGVFKGVRESRGAPFRVILNSVLNNSSTMPIRFANQIGILSIYYHVFEGIAGKFIRSENPAVVPMISASLSALFYKSATSTKAMAYAVLISAVFSTAVFLVLGKLPLQGLTPSGLYNEIVNGRPTLRAERKDNELVRKIETYYRKQFSHYRKEKEEKKIKEERKKPSFEDDGSHGYRPNYEYSTSSFARKDDSL